MKEISRYHYFYKITNNINGHFYYGVHNTNDLDDGYMGSGKRLHIAYKKYGIDNFTKEIIRFFDTAEDAFNYESEIVTEKLVDDPNCYNLCTGGKSGCSNMVIVRDMNGNIFGVTKEDPRYISGELIPYGFGQERNWLKKYFLAKDSYGNIYRITNEDPRYLSGKLVGITKNMVSVIDKDGNKLFISSEEYYNNPKYKTGELKTIWTGRKHKQSTIEKMKETFKKTGHQKGSKNSGYNTCWIYNMELKKSIKIKRSELNQYLSTGWVAGRKMKF